MNGARVDRALTTARVLAAVQSAVWFIMLIFGGQGFVFAPLGLLAVVLGGRYPIAGVLLAPPIVWLTLSWASILARTTAAAPWLTWGVLVAPASLGILVFSAIAIQEGMPTKPPR